MPAPATPAATARRRGSEEVEPRSHEGHEAVLLRLVPDREVAHSVLSLYSSQDNRGTEAAREVEPGFAPFVISWFNLFKRPGVQSGKAKQENDSMAKHSPAFLKIVNEVKPRIKETNVAEVKRRMDRGDRKFKLVDVREESEFAAGHIPGAMHIGKGVIERDIEQKIPTPSDEIILYCGGGFRSALAADNLQKMGYTNVLSMDGGWRGWTEAGNPVAKGDEVNNG